MVCVQTLMIAVRRSVSILPLQGNLISRNCDGQALSDATGVGDLSKTMKNGTAFSSASCRERKKCKTANPVSTIVSAVPVETAVDDSTRQQGKLTNQICVDPFHNPALVNVHQPCEHCCEYRSLQMSFYHFLTHVLAYNMLLTTGDILFSQTLRCKVVS